MAGCISTEASSSRKGVIGFCLVYDSVKAIEDRYGKGTPFIAVDLDIPTTGRGK